MIKEGNVTLFIPKDKQTGWKGARALSGDTLHAPEAPIKNYYAQLYVIFTSIRSETRSLELGL